jgi:arylsulfatase A-like enzyme
MDEEVGRFLDGLRDKGILANTWVVITSDHGEHFGEHYQFGHGSSLYNELTHVPLIVIPPLSSGSPDRDPARALRGRRITVPVSTRNLARTMVSLIDPVAPNPFPGCSLAEHWKQDPPGQPHMVLAQIEEPDLSGADFRTENVTRVDSLIDRDRVLIDTRNQPLELYDLFADPRQERNLAELPSERSRLQQLKRRLDSIQLKLGRTPDRRELGAPRLRK